MWLACWCRKILLALTPHTHTLQQAADAVWCIAAMQFMKAVAACDLLIAPIPKLYIAAIAP
jgi:hypothetical protein